MLLSPKSTSGSWMSGKGLLSREALGLCGDLCRLLVVERGWRVSHLFPFFVTFWILDFFSNLFKQMWTSARLETGACLRWPLEDSLLPLASIIPWQQLYLWNVSDPVVGSGAPVIWQASTMWPWQRLWNKNIREINTQSPTAREVSGSCQVEILVHLGREGKGARPPTLSCLRENIPLITEPMPNTSN